MVRRVGERGKRIRAVVFITEVNVCDFEEIRQVREELGELGAELGLLRM